MHAACLAGSVELTHVLISFGANLSCLDANKFLPLHYAIVRDRVDVANFLFKEKKIRAFEAHYKCHGHTLLALAIHNGSFNIVKAMVNEWGADAQALDDKQYTYLHMAAMSGHVNVFLFFLTKNVDLHARTFQGKTAIELARE